jgi:hypothetical protein
MFNPKSHLVSSDLDHSQDNVVANDDALAFLAWNHDQGWASLKGGGLYPVVTSQKKSRSISTAGILTIALIACQGFAVADHACSQVRSLRRVWRGMITYR